MPTRSEIRAFGRQVQRGDRFVNRYQEHNLPPLTRTLTVTIDVRATALFVLTDDAGKTTIMRTRTLITRYVPIPDGGFIREQR